MTDFTDEMAARHARQTIIPEIGIAGQERLLAGSALVVGAGGLGSPALLYLTAAGVGRIGVVDADAVETTNLNRQIAHGTRDMGRNKAESAADAMRAIDPSVRVVVYPQRLTAANAIEILSGWDVVLDCSDNFPTRYLINDACVLLGIPLVTAAVMRFHGQITTVVPRAGACLRCILPEPPQPGSGITPAEAGILGPVAGVFGSLQAIEAKKVLMRLPGILQSRIHALDALTFEASTMEVARDPACPVCGDEPRITALQDAPDSC